MSNLTIYISTLKKKFSAAHDTVSLLTRYARYDTSDRNVGSRQTRSTDSQVGSRRLPSSFVTIAIYRIVYGTIT